MLVALILVPLIGRRAGAGHPVEPLAAVGAAAGLAGSPVRWRCRASRIPAPAAAGWLLLDPPGRLVLLMLSVLFLLCSVYSIGYLHHRAELSNRVFVMCLLIFLAMTTLVTCARHLGLMWVAVEATTLSTAPLIYFNRTQRSIEATWKYLLVGSVGIAIALLGSFFLAYASLGRGGEPSLLFDDLLARAPLLDKSWLRSGIRPAAGRLRHQDGPGADAHLETRRLRRSARASSARLLAGGLTNCAFLALLRIHQICQAAGESPYTGRLMIFIGLLSMAVAAVFMVGQRDYQTHAGLFQRRAHGNIGAGRRHRRAGDVRRAAAHDQQRHDQRACCSCRPATSTALTAARRPMRCAARCGVLPFSGTLFLLGFFAITGSPPFGPFVSEFTILNGALPKGDSSSARRFLFLLLIIFIGMGRTVLTVVQGRPLPGGRRTAYRDGLFTGLPILLSLGIVLLLGVHIPAFLKVMLRDAAHFLEVRP